MLREGSKGQSLLTGVTSLAYRQRVRVPALGSSEWEAFLIGYVTLGSNDLGRAARFYDALAQELGIGRMMENEQFIAWGVRGGGAGLGVTKPFDGEGASVGNGVMVALHGKDRAQVDRLYAIALDAGAKDEGAPGERFPGFYAAYFRDPDGNKLNAFVMEGAGDHATT